MIFRNCLIISVFVVWISKAGPNDSVLSPIIEKSASLARISAAISIHNGIYSKNSTVQEVTAEFLDISPSVAKELLAHDYRSLSDNMEKFHGSLSKIPAKLKNGDELIKTIDLLLNMKVNQKYLKPGAMGDQTEHFSKTATIMKSSEILSEKMFHVPSLNTALGLLKTIRKTTAKNITTGDIVKILSSLAKKLSATEAQLKMLNDYKSSLKDYLSLNSLTDDLQNVVSAARIAGEYSEIVKELDPFRKDLIAVSKDTDKIKEAINEILKYSEPIQNLFSTSTLLNSTAPKYDGKLITRGLLGYKDLNNIWKDFENPWFRQNVLQNLEFTSLKEGLESLKPFVSALDSLIPSKRLDNENEKKSIIDLVKKINKIHEIGSKVKSFTNVNSPYEEVSACIEPLRPIQNPPDQAMFKRIVNFAGEVVENVKSFRGLMDDLNKNGLESIIMVSEEIRKTTEHVKKTKNDSLKIEMWDKARKLEDDHKLANKLQWIVDKLSGVDSSDFFMEDRDIDYTVIRTVSTVFEGTNVDSVLNCIQKKSVDDLIGMLVFVDKSDSLKNQKTEFTTATDFIKHLLKIQTNFQNLIKKTKSAKVSKESQAIIDVYFFQEVGTDSKVIGASVAALRAIESVLKTEKSIRSVVEVDSEVKFEIQKNLGLKSTDALIHEMKQVQTSVGEIRKVLEAKRIDSIFEIQSTLNTLSKLKLPSTIGLFDVSVLALELSNQADPKLQSLAKELFAISRLDMRFANFLKSCRVGTVVGKFESDIYCYLQKKIGEREVAMGIGKSKAKEEEEKKFDLPTFIICFMISSVVFLLLALLLIEVYFRKKRSKDKKAGSVKIGDLESGVHGKASKGGIRFKESKSKMSKPKEQGKKPEDEKKKEERKEKSKISQISLTPKSAEQ